jgi:hypothetical protein
VKRSIILFSICLIPVMNGCSGSKGDAIVPVNPDGSKPPGMDANNPPDSDGGPVADVSPPEAPGVDTGPNAPDGKRDTTPPNPNVIWDPANAKALRAYEVLGGIAPGSSFGCNNYALDVATKSLTFTNSCPNGAPPPPKTRTLTTGEYAMVDAAMAKLTISSNTNCGADKGAMTVEVETTDGTKTTYWDSFYACAGMGRKFVDMIDGVMSTLRTLSQ